MSSQNNTAYLFIPFIFEKQDDYPALIDTLDKSTASGSSRASVLSASSCSPF